MPTLNVRIPSMGESIVSGVLAKWHVKEGDLVKKDQPLFELETDKITSEGAAESAGRIALKVAAGAEVSVGQLVATIDTGEQARIAGAAGASVSTEPPPPPAPDLPVSPSVRRLAAEAGLDPAAVAGTGKGGRVTKGDLLAAADAGKRTGDAGTASPGAIRPPQGPLPPPGFRSPESAAPAAGTRPVAGIRRPGSNGPGVQYPG